MAAARGKKRPDALTVYVGGEEFKLTEVQQVDGQPMEVPSLGWLDKLNFKEQNIVRRLARELSGLEQGDWTEFAFQDVVPPLVAVVNQRSDEDYTLDQALELDWEKVTTRPPKAAA